MTIYFQIFSDSLQSVIILSTKPEWVYFAAVGFGGINVMMATFAAVVGSACGMFINFGFGYYLSTTRERWPHYDEVFYAKLSRIGRWLALILLLPEISIFGIFMPLFTAFLGALRVPPLLMFALIIAGRTGYYSYYLLNH